MKWIPKKYMENITEVYKDSEGWWAYSKKGYRFEGMGCHTAHEDTQKDLLAMIRTLVPCDCEQCVEIEVEETEVIEEEKMNVVQNELTDFKRYCELLEKVYGMKTTSTEEEKQEMDALGYKLKLNGVPEIISEMNFNKLENQLHLESLLEKEQHIESLLEKEQIQTEIVEFEIFEPALEIRIRDIKTNQIESWYCQKFDSKQDYDQEVNRQFDLKEYYKQTHLFEIEHINLKYMMQVKKVFEFKHKDCDLIYTCRVHPDNVAEITWTDQAIFHSSLYSIDHLKLSIKHGDWVVAI